MTEIDINSKIIATDDPEDIPYCDFCGKVNTHVKALIRSSTERHICDECVTVCVDIITKIER
jgi:hypothetical protein